MALSQGIGASTSNVMAGFVVNNFGFDGVCFYGLLMPETKNKVA